MIDATRVVAKREGQRKAPCLRCWQLNSQANRTIRRVHRFREEVNVVVTDTFGRRRGPIVNVRNLSLSRGCLEQPKTYNKKAPDKNPRRVSRHGFPPGLMR